MKILKKGKSYILTFPFFVYAKTNSLSIQTIKLSPNKILRIYPLYRQSNANFVYMPHINISKTPFIKKPSRKSSVYNIPKLVAIPRLDKDNNGQFQNHLTWSENFDDKFSPFPYDSIRIDVHGESNENEIAEITKKLMEQIRWRTNQWWINRTIADLFGHMRGSFDIDKNGNPIRDSYGHIQATTVRGTEKDLNNEIWKDCIESLTKNDEPIFHEMLFLDSLYYQYSKNIKLSIFHMAITCEQALEYYAFQKWQSLDKAKKFKKSRVFKGDDLIKHIDIQSLNYFGNSYKIFNKDNFELIEIMWKTRNNIAHGGFLKIHNNGDLVEIDLDMVKKISYAVEDFTSWLKIQLEN